MFLKIQLKENEEFNLNDLFNVQITNPNKETFSVRIKFEILSENEDVFIKFLSEKFELMPLKDTILDVENMFFKQIEYNGACVNRLTKNMRELPRGIYVICVNIIDSRYDILYGNDSLQISKGVGN